MYIFYYINKYIYICLYLFIIYDMNAQKLIENNRYLQIYLPYIY